MYIHRASISTTPEQDDIPPRIGEDGRESIAFCRVVRFSIDYDESNESGTWASPDNDAGEGQEEAMIGPASQSSEDSTQLIPPQNAPLIPGSTDRKDVFDRS